MNEDQITPAELLADVLDEMSEIAQRLEELKAEAREYIDAVS